MRKYIFSFGVVIIIGFILHNINRNTEKKDSTVVGVFPVTVDAFVQFQNRAKTTLNDAGLKFVAYSAEGDASRFHTILDTAILERPAVLITVGTQLTNVGLSPRYMDFSNPIIASCISDVSKVSSLLEIGVSPPRERNVAILTDMPKNSAYELSAKAFKALLPNKQTIGVLYNTAEINSVNTAKNLTEAMQKNGIAVLDGIISSEGDVIRMATELVRKGAQVLVIPHDKYVIKQAAGLSKLGREWDPTIPVFSLDDGTVRTGGAAFGVSIDYGEIGDLTAKVAISIVQGDVEASKMEIVQLENANLVVNKKVWKQLNLPEISTEISERFNPIMIE